MAWMSERAKNTTNARPKSCMRPAVTRMASAMAEICLFCSSVNSYWADLYSLIGGMSGAGGGLDMGHLGDGNGCPDCTPEVCGSRKACRVRRGSRENLDAPYKPS